MLVRQSRCFIWSQLVVLSYCVAAAIQDEVGFRRGYRDGLLNYETKYYNQPVDHFGFTPTCLVLQQRYLISTQYWQQPSDEHGPGPILLYTGNEGDITEFARATGFIWDIAPKLGALVVFAEARYYGKSIPTPRADQKCYTTYNEYQYLSTQQILADHAALIAYLRDSFPSGWDAAVVAIGGSYGGMLAAWLRYQFPHLVDGALAASAPVAGFASTGVYDVVGQDFARHGCAEGLHRAFQQIWKDRDSVGGRILLETRLSICTEAASSSRLLSVTDVEAFIGWSQKQLFTLAELDYPSASRFMDMKLPGHPVRAACAAFNASLRSTADIVQALGSAVSIATNYSGEAGQCLRWQTQGSMRRLTFKDTLPGFIDGPWTYQRCSQVIIPYAVRDSESSSSIPQAFLGCNEFPSNCWNETSFAEWCNHHYGIIPSPRAELLYFGGSNLSGRPLGGGASNIIFSNGNLDPWAAGGIHHNLTNSVVAISIDGGAHHLDLRFASPGDPPSVVHARAQEEAIIRTWVAAKRTLSNPSLENIFM